MKSSSHYQILIFFLYAFTMNLNSAMEPSTESVNDFTPEETKQTKENIKKLISETLTQLIFATFLSTAIELEEVSENFPHQTYLSDYTGGRSSEFFFIHFFSARISNIESQIKKFSESTEETFLDLYKETQKMLFTTLLEIQITFNSSTYLSEQYLEKIKILAPFFDSYEKDKLETNTKIILSIHINKLLELNKELLLKIYDEIKNMPLRIDPFSSKTSYAKSLQCLISSFEEHQERTNAADIPEYATNYFEILKMFPELRIACLLARYLNKTTAIMVHSQTCTNHQKCEKIINHLIKLGSSRSHKFTKLWEILIHRQFIAYRLNLKIKTFSIANSLWLLSSDKRHELDYADKTYTRFYKTYSQECANIIK